MTTIQLNDQIIKAAEETIKVAKKELGITLDYSVNSLEDIEPLIQHVKKYFSQLSGEGKLTDKTVLRASTSIGSYIGETIRRQYDGSWIEKNDIIGVLVIKGQEFSPIRYVSQRLTRNLDFSVQAFCSEINQKINPHANLATEKSNLEEPKKPNASNDKNKILLIVGGLGIVVLCLLIGIGYSIFSNIQKSNEANANTRATNEANAKFNNDYNAFLVEAEKLNVMTEQGVTNNDFRNQLAEVKTRYVLIGNSWPSAYQNAKKSFDLALKGWDLVIEVWDIEIQGGIFITDSLAVGVASYLGTSQDNVSSKLTKDLVGDLMAKSSTYFEAGKAGIR